MITTYHSHLNNLEAYHLIISLNDAQHLFAYIQLPHVMLHYPQTCHLINQHKAIMNKQQYQVMNTSSSHEQQYQFINTLSTINNQHLIMTSTINKL